MNLKIRSGIGYDLHTLAEGGELKIGGIKVADGIHFNAHSDGDVLIHAIIDALLGAANLGDIGQHFPDTDQQWKDADSSHLLQLTQNLLQRNKIEIINLDCLVIAEKIKIFPFKEAMTKKISSTLGIAAEKVSVKGKSKEGVDAVGRGEAIECFAVAMIRQE